MPCYKPLRAWTRCGASGKQIITFSPEGNPNETHSIDLPCGQCIGCRLSHAQDRSLRCMHEASQHENNCFITLTYDDENLPSDHSLHKSHWQKFLKRLRAHFAPKKKFRFLMCGEYGEDQDAKIFGLKKLGRPHYHALLFGLHFDDQYVHDVRNDLPVYRSDTLEKYWTFGFSEIGSLTLASAGYVSRYVLKKIGGDTAEEHYNYHCPILDQLIPREPEFALQSLKPGLGYDYCKKHKREIIHNDDIVHDGRRHPVPTYYDKLLSTDYPNRIKSNKQNRKISALKHSKDQTPTRLRTREKVKHAQINNLKRTLS